MSAQDVALYYDELHRWTARDKDFQVFSGRESDTIHRFLIDADTGAFSPDTVYKFVDPHIATLTPIRGLDAGSGYGGTCFRCLHVHGGQWTGVTISPEQWTSAKRNCEGARLRRAASTFICRPTTRPLPGRYNVMVAIESLIHAADPAHTIANLASAIDPGGRLILIDDMPVDAVPESDRAHSSPNSSAAGAARWRRAPQGWIAAAAAAGLRLVSRKDLSDLMKPRAERDLDAAFADLSSQAGEKAEHRLRDA